MMNILLEEEQRLRAQKMCNIPDNLINEDYRLMRVSSVGASSDYILSIGMNRCEYELNPQEAMKILTGEEVML